MTVPRPVLASLVVSLGLSGWLTIREVALEDGLLATLALVGGVTAGGVAAILYLSRRLGDPRLVRVAHVFLGKIPLMLGMLMWTWSPLVGPASSKNNDYSMYFWANAVFIANAGFGELGEILPVNYTGAVLVYAGVFKVFGVNPIAPALVNTALSLTAVLLLVAVAYRLVPFRRPNDWALGLVIVIPELLWFDVFTNKDILTTSIVTVAVLLAASVLDERGARRSMWRALVGLAALSAIGPIRGSVLLPAAVTIGLFNAVAFCSGARRRAVVLTALLVLVVVVSPLANSLLSAHPFSFVETIVFPFQLAAAIEAPDRVSALGQPGERYLQVSQTLHWNDRSVGRLLIARTPLEAVALLPARIVAALLAPWPYVPAVRDLISRDWTAWHVFMASASALLYIALVPLVMAGLVHGLRTRHWQRLLVFYLPLVTLLGAAAFGHQFIDSRYRLISVPFLAGCAWLGQRGDGRLLARLYWGWGFLLVAGGLLYMAYKGQA